jgi:hypothetical protein
MKKTPTRPLWIKEDLHQKIKIKSAVENTTMLDLVTEILEDYFKKEKSKK